MEWSRGFTALLLRFATRFAAIEGVALDGALLRATPNCHRLGTHGPLPAIPEKGKPRVHVLLPQ
jgi:hypothetical protein